MGRLLRCAASPTRLQSMGWIETDKRARIPGDYSKGTRKHVAMAAALIHRPELFLLDEPFEGVDAVGARLMNRCAIMFLTSHVLEVAGAALTAWPLFTMARWW